MKTTLKEVFQSGDWIITKVTQGRGEHRIDAKRRFPKADHPSLFSKWATNEYLERLSKENYGKKLSDFKNYRH